MKYTQSVLVALLAGTCYSEAFSLQAMSRASSVSFLSNKPATSSALFASTLEEKEAVIKNDETVNSANLVEEEGIVAADKDEIISEELLKELELETQKTVDELLEEACEVDYQTGGPKDEICFDEEKKEGFRASLKRVVGKTLQLVRGSYSSAEQELAEEYGTDEVPQGEILEKGWEKRANSSAIVRNAEVWKFALAAVTRVLKAKKLKVKGASDEEIKEAQIQAAEFIRDNLLKLGPSFVKASIDTRTFCPVFAGYIQFANHFFNYISLAKSLVREPTCYRLHTPTH